MTDGFVLLAAWLQFALLLGALAAVILGRGTR